jgi:hypothetical protein
MTNDLGVEAKNDDDVSYRGSRFSEIRDTIFANPYQRVWGQPGEPDLPVYPVNLSGVLRGIFSFGTRYLFLQASQRTVDSAAELRWGRNGRGFRRILHPNGVCLTGQWKITEDTEYTGYFAKGSTALTVGRYSTCCTETRRGYYRSLALVGKLFPTNDPNNSTRFHTANFMTQQDIGGALTASINDAELLNAPDTAASRRGAGIPILLVTGSIPRAYIGVYMAWRGQSVPGDLFATFWNRRDAAQRVGSSDFAEALYRIMGTVKDGSPNSRIVIVGHSFGARVLENALTNTFVSLLVPHPTSTGESQIPRQLSPADLILYVNPATDSFRTKQMVELMKRTNFTVMRGEARLDGPLFMSVTSTGDTATGTAFPLGQDLSALQKSFRSGYAAAPPPAPSQRTFFTHTPGHIPYLFSHVVHAVTGACGSQPEVLRFSAGAQCFEMTPVAKRWIDSPFWVMIVPPAIIRDHVDIFNSSFSTMIISLMERYQVLDSPQATTMVQAQ